MFGIGHTVTELFCAEFNQASVRMELQATVMRACGDATQDCDTFSNSAC